MAAAASPDSSAFRPRKQKRVAVARVEREHALQNFFRAAPRSPAAQRFSGSGENLPGIRFLAQTDVDLGQTHAHGDVFRVHLKNFLEDADGLFEFSGAQEFFRHLQVLGARIVEQTLLGVKLGQLQNAFQRRLELAIFLYIAMPLTVKPCVA